MALRNSMYLLCGTKIQCWRPTMRRFKLYALLPCLLLVLAAPVLTRLYTPAEVDYIIPDDESQGQKLRTAGFNAHASR